MPTLYQPSEYPELLGIVNETYTDRAEKVVAAQLEDDGETTTAVLMDGIKKLAARITPNQILIKLLNPNDIKDDEPGSAQFTEGVDDRDTVDYATDRTSVTAADIVTDWVASLRRSLDGANSLAEFQEGLVAQYSELDGEEMRSILADAFLATSLAAQEEGY